MEQAVIETPDDIEGLVQSSQTGAHESFRELVEHFESMIFSQMTRFSKDRNIVETLTHDVFVEAYVSLHGFQFKSPFEHWLRKVAVRVGYKFWRDESKQRKRSEALQRVAGEETTSSPQDRLAEFEELHFVLGQLPPRDRLVLTLLYWDNLSIEQAAEFAGWSKTMTKVQAHRARKKLAKLIKERA